MPLTLVCRRCGTEVHLGDSFCQECGLRNTESGSFSRSESFSGSAASNDSAPSMFDSRKSAADARLGASGISDFDWPALESDPIGPYSSPLITNVGGQTYEFGGFQLDLQPLPDLEPRVTEPLERLNPPPAFESAPASAPASESAQEMSEAELEISRSMPAIPDRMVAKECQTASSAQTRLHSPMFDTDVNREIVAYNDGLGMRGGWTMVALDLAIVASVICFVSVLAVWIFTNHEKHINAGTFNVLATVKLSAAKHDYKTVMTNLTLLKTKSNVSLSQAQQDLFDNSAMALAQKAIAEGKDAQAVDYLKQVSIASEHYVSARHLIFDFSNIVKASSASTTKVSATSTATNGAEQQKNKALKFFSTDAPKLSDKPVLSIPVIPEIENAAKQQKEGADNSTGNGQPAVEVPAPKFSETEISRYNRLLAGYFAKHADDKDASSSVTEPPAFKEWLKQGKPSF